MPAWYRRELSVGDEGADVLIVRAKLGMSSGQFDWSLHAKLAGWCESRGIPFSGVLGSEIAETLGEDAAYGCTPSWFGDDEATARRLGVRPERLEQAVRQWQSEVGLPTTGVITEEDARLLGE